MRSNDSISVAQPFIGINHIHGVKSPDMVSLNSATWTMSKDEVSFQCHRIRWPPSTPCRSSIIFPSKIAHLFTNHGDDDDEEIRQMITALLTINVQADMATGGFIDHLCSWADGNYQASTRSDVGCRYKLAGGISSLAQTILDDCRDVRLLLSTPIVSFHSTGQLFRSRVTVINVPLNFLNTLHFYLPLFPEK